MAEINEIVAQLQQDKEFWQLKYNQALRNAVALGKERDEVQEDKALLVRDNNDLRQSRDDYAERCDELFQSNDGLEDRNALLNTSILNLNANIARMADRARRNVSHIAEIKDLLAEYEI